MRLLQGILISLLLVSGSLATDVSSLSDAEVEQIAITALQQAAGLIDLQEEAIKGDNDGSSGVAGPNSQKATNDSITIQKKGDLLVSASQLLVEQYGEAILERLATLDVDALIDKAGIKLADEHARRKRQYGKGGTSQDESDACLPKPSPCIIDRNFRSISGWCNNLKNPSFGSTMSTLRRLLKPAYQDGLNQPRLKMQSGRPLKSARLISNEIMQDTREESIYDPKPMEHLYMLFGQFIAHDVILMPTATNKNGTALDCSACNSGDLNANCAPIQIPADDPYFPTRTAKREPACMRLARGINGQNGFGSRIQLNQNSHHLDLSDVYGSTECVAKQLRTFSGGQMKTYTYSGYQLPPQDKNDSNCQSSPKYYCFLAGDLRNSLHPGLIVLHTAFLKQHNTIASGLQKLKPTLSDEQLYQTARRIIIAWYQNIVYGEYLPQLLGTDFMTKFGLNLSPNAYFRGYDDSVNAATSADFTTAAFRFGHSQARTDHWRTNNANASVATPLNHGNNTFYADQNYDVPTGEVRSLAEGFQSVPTRRMDRYFSFSMRNQLFEIRSKQGSGVDLAAVNIQRGREVGLPPYNDFRQLAGLSRARDWTDFTNIPTNEINKIKTMYDGPNDVDLYVGILSENRVRGGLIGQTGAYIIGEQFRAFKTGDRYYFENQNSTNYEAFTLAQLNQIRTLTLHKLLCANFQGMNNVRKSFDFTQGRQACSSLPAFDVNVFANANWAVAPTRSPSRGTSPKPPPNDGHRDDGRQQDHNGGGGRGGHGGGHH